MTLKEILQEFAKGCSNGKPGECEECLDAALGAIERQYAGKPITSETSAEIIYARDLDGTGSMHICSKEDPGAVAFGDLDSHDDKSVAWDMMCKARAEGYDAGLAKAESFAQDVSINGGYDGEASVDSCDAIYQGGAQEVLDEILEERGKQ